MKSDLLVLNQSPSGIYIDTGLCSAANTVIPANAGIQGAVQDVLSWTPAQEGFCSFRLRKLRKLTHCRLPKQTLGSPWY